MFVRPDVATLPASKSATNFHGDRRASGAKKKSVQKDTRRETKIILKIKFFFLSRVTARIDYESADRLEKHQGNSCSTCMVGVLESGF